jgi:hypothetical protein
VIETKASHKKLFLLRGTDVSNPSPSSGESRANLKTTVAEAERLVGAHRASVNDKDRWRPSSWRGGWRRFQGALSTKALLLPPGAFALVPPLHGDRLRIAVPMTTTPIAISHSGTPSGRSPFHS